MCKKCNGNELYKGLHQTKTKTKRLIEVLKIEFFLDVDDDYNFEGRTNKGPSSFDPTKKEREQNGK